MLAERFRRWLELEQTAHERVLAAFDTVPADRRQDPEYGRAIDLLAHVAAARGLWLARFGVEGAETPELFPHDATLFDVAARLARVQSRWSSWLADLDDVDLARTFSYHSIDGGHWENSFEDILAQLNGHSWYHRGQIAQTLRRLGGEPAVTDLVYLTRRGLEG